MQSPKESLPHFLKAVLQTGMSPDLFVYVSSMTSELRWNYKNESIFKLQAGNDGSIGVHAPDGETCVFSGSQPDSAGKWQSLELNWSGHVDIFPDVQKHDIEDAVIEQFNLWCMDHCPLGYSVALDMVQTESQQALDKTRWYRGIGQSGHNPEGIRPRFSW